MYTSRLSHNFFPSTRRNYYQRRHHDQRRKRGVIKTILLSLFSPTRSICVIFFMMVIFSNMVFLHWLTQETDGMTLQKRSEAGQHLLLKNGVDDVVPAQPNQPLDQLLDDDVIRDKLDQQKNDDNNVRAKPDQRTNDNKNKRDKLDQQKNDDDNVRSKPDQRTNDNDNERAKLDQQKNDDDNVRAKPDQRTNDNENKRDKLDQQKNDDDNVRAKPGQRTNDNDNERAKLDQQKNDDDNVRAKPDQRTNGNENKRDKLDQQKNDDDNVRAKPDQRTNDNDNERAKLDQQKNDDDNMPPKLDQRTNDNENERDKLDQQKNDDDNVRAKPDKRMNDNKNEPTKLDQHKNVEAEMRAKPDPLKTGNAGMRIEPDQQKNSDDKSQAKLDQRKIDDDIKPVQHILRVRQNSDNDDDDVDPVKQKDAFINNDDICVKKILVLGSIKQVATWTGISPKQSEWSFLKAYEIAEEEVFHRGIYKCRFINCSIELTFGSNYKRHVPGADVVILNVVPSNLKKNAQKLFASDPPPPRKQVWIFYSMETPRVATHFSLNGKTLGDVPVHGIWTYHYESHIKAVYGYYKLGPPVLETETKSDDFWIKSKTKLVAWMASNCKRTQWPRTDFVSALQNHIPIDIYGKCGNLSCKRGRDTCTNLMKTYKFYLALENAECEHYITEKFWDNALKLGIVPIAYGARKEDYEKLAPKNSFIYAGDFNSTKDLADYMLKLDRRPDLYAKYFEWRYQGSFRLLPRHDLFCDSVSIIDKVKNNELEKKPLSKFPWFNSCRNSRSQESRGTSQKWKWW